MLPLFILFRKVLLIVPFMQLNFPISSFKSKSLLYDSVHPKNLTVILKVNTNHKIKSVVYQSFIGPVWIPCVVVPFISLYFISKPHLCNLENWDCEYVVTF